MTQPILWQIDISHYSEKARWALDYKSVPYRRRAPVPSLHIPIAMWLTKGAQKTFPVLELDGERIGDSTAIIAALERRFPDPPLYPEDPVQRRRALDLEDWFDEELGPHVRLLAFHELSREPERFGELMMRTMPPPLNRWERPVGAYGRAYVALRFGVRDAAAAEVARGKVLAALDRLEAELGDGEYLVGERLSVADLTAAALFHPLVMPPEGPLPPIEMPAAYERLRASVADRPGFRWVAETFRRHRGGSAAAAEDRDLVVGR